MRTRRMVKKGGGQWHQKGCEGVRDTKKVDEHWTVLQNIIEKNWYQL
jgi:hypothetical protein